MSTGTIATPVTRAEVVAAAIADCWAEDGEVFASPMGLLPTLGARLCRLTANPDLVLSDGESVFLASPPPLGSSAGPVEGWIPFRKVFDVVAWGRRHVMMGATQLDRHGNQNISAIGPFDRPTRQLLGSRGAPGNTINHTTSYFIGNHTSRCFVEKVDTVSGIGYDRAAQMGPWVQEHHEIRRVVTNLAVLDFATPDHRMRLASVHPGVSVDDVVAATGFELVIDGEVPTTRTPTDEELAVLRDVLDPRSFRDRELPAPA